MDPTLVTILAFGFLMAAIALVGGAFVLLPDEVLKRILHALVAFAAGSLIGGAMFFMLPHAFGPNGGMSQVPIFGWFVVGFAAFIIAIAPPATTYVLWGRCSSSPTGCTTSWAAWPSARSS